MGLDEKRAAKSFEEGKFPALKKTILDAAGFDIAIEVDWDKLAVDKMSHLYDKSWDKLYFAAIESAFKEICQDDMGKEALHGALKKIVITNTKRAYSPANAISFEGGTLTIDHDLTNVENIAERSKFIVDLLSKAL